MRGDAGRAPYWLTRFVILRLLGLVYFIAFLSLAQQVLPLIGADGLLPARLFLDRVQTHFGSARAGFLQIPSLFWLDVSDGVLVTGAWVGTALSLVVVLGFANAVLLAMLWALYLSFVHIGQDWYGYGWEIQLLDTGFLAVFLCPLLDARPFPRQPPPVAVIWCFRWLVFRIMVGAGLIKLRGDPCWRNLTCLYYHYETQPIPNPLSRRLHFMPRWFHRAGVVFNHVAELGAPWFAFWPRIARHAAGTVLLAFQLFLIASGNLSFLNWLTIVPILACFDDTLLARVLPRRLVVRAARAAAAAAPSRWEPYEFKCKPGDPARQPCVIAPYQYRIDWQIWFAAMSTADRYPWTLHLLWKLLHNDPGALSLLATNPFPDAPPRWIRARLYR